MDSDKRKTIRIKAQIPDIQRLKALRDQILGSFQRKFVLRYGRILELIKVLLKVEAMTTLAQFYDPPLQYFLFQDFQLAPTL